MRGGFRAFILGLFCRPLFRAVFLGAFSRNADRPLWIVDIDNTLAHTWPSLNEKHGSEKERMLSLPPLNGMCEKVRAASPASAEVLFVSVRPYGMYFVTRKWLRAQRLPVNFSNLVLVQDPSDKLELIRLALSGSRRTVEYYDDLSYHHETGRTEFYENIINAVKALPLKYVGYAELSSINGKNE